MIHNQNGEAIISCENVSKRYGAFVALKNVSLNVAKGEVVCIVGPSGGGKSPCTRHVC